MPYSTREDIEAAFPEHWETVADVTGDGSVDATEDAAIDLAIAWADAVIDSHLGVKYDLPLADTSAPMLRNLSIDLALYRLASTSDRLTESIENRHRQAKEWLAELRDGSASLAISNPPNSHGPGVVLSGNEREFTKAKWGEL